MKNSFLLIGITILFCIPNLAQPKIDKAEPLHWYIGMEDPTFQLMLYGPDISLSEIEIKDHKVSIVDKKTTENPNYLFLYLKIDPTRKEGPLNIDFLKDGKKLRFEYQLHKKKKHKDLKEINSGDVLYLIMPDRFADGDPSSNSVDGYLEKANRQNPGGKHGGDIQGIINNLDYIDNLGVTTIWLNPVQENNMPSYSYHGYSITDYYHIDIRLGSNELYKDFVSKTHDREMKVVMDLIFNHIGSNHYWVKDLPSEDWIHQWDEYTQTNYTGAVVSDPYASEYDHKRMVDGWFVETMPDLNQKNQLLADYLIQASLWWIEYSGIDGIRMDTYPYPDKDMMARWVQRVKSEYPGFYIVGETWLNHASLESYWAGKKDSEDEEYNSYLPSISDFPVCIAIQNAFKPEGSVYNLYEVLAKDFLFDNPFMNKIFADNHDMDRILHTLNNDYSKFKLAMVTLMTTRGIPQLLYGTEVVMNGYGDHGVLRADFPGGWEGDSVNVFTGVNVSKLQSESLEFMKTLMNWRKDSEAIAKGTLKHYIPENEVYVYERKYNDKKVIVIINNNSTNITLNLNRYRESIKQGEVATNILTGDKITIGESMILSPTQAIILDFN
ncbi:glycoside hydrolase family 13 protein [Marinigracilibium pacificum]|uniref:Glycoside hydrolase family 13 protein n=1 Tax=Marinigracilibium pacificum TaxID=2729599 RepID=A0A848J7M5_9BACT|nr:glycoside hydrolase family 13 protein [Marinigracilibium pacificum]NMM50424.1 glycoside hydrolase family 13 protein [Marinigracilibium pacificum]